MKSVDRKAPDTERAATPRIMIVDDMPENLTLLRNMLSNYGFEVYALPSGARALQAAERIVPDMILLDITMPEMNGYEVCEKLKQLPSLSEVPIIFLSALSDTMDKLKAFESGGVDFVTKPVQFDELHARIMTHLKISRLQQHLESRNENLQGLIEDKVKQLSEAQQQSHKWKKDIAEMNRSIATSVQASRAEPVSLTNSPHGQLVQLSLAPAPLAVERNDEIGELIGHFNHLIRDRVEAAAKIEFIAHYDALTGIPNRLLVQDRFEQAKQHADQHGLKVGLLYLDLDNFKAVNDSLGHAVGDEMLKAVAAQLRAHLRQTDTVGRMGGDEYLIVLPGMVCAGQIENVLKELLSQLSDPVFIDERELSISASIGVAVYPDDGFDFSAIYKKADTAMYQAKEAGRDTYRFFSNLMNVQSVESLELRSKLKRALKNQEFVLHYQPQIDLVSGAVIGAEALIRWNHPEDGLVYPGKFISIAEDSGLIVPIGEWVLREACRQAMEWQVAGLPEMVMAVNLSAVQFKRGDLEQTLVSALNRSGLRPDLLELELTESILIKDTEKVLQMVRRLKSIGVKLSIDDFGTGYSSLAYLKKFAVDKLKIDQSFVRDLAHDPDDAAIVQAIIQMAHSLNLRTIAEGVEDQETLEELRARGCDEVQGYHFAKPMPADQFERFVTAFQVQPQGCQLPVQLALHH